MKKENKTKTSEKRFSYDDRQFFFDAINYYIYDKLDEDDEEVINFDNETYLYIEDFILGLAKRELKND